MTFTAEEWHGWLSSTEEATAEAHAQKGCLEFAREHVDKGETVGTVWSNETKICFVVLL